jgi:hypothetical protein
MFWQHYQTGKEQSTYRQNLRWRKKQVSRSYLMGCDKDFNNFRKIKEYSNSWLTFPMVLDLEGISMRGTESQFDEWHKKAQRLIKANKIPEALIILHTYYPVLIHKSLFPHFIEMCNLIEKRWASKRNSGQREHLHYKQIAEDVQELSSDIEYLTIKGTSCDDLYEFDEDNIKIALSGEENSGTILIIENNVLIGKNLKTGEIEEI